MASYRTGCVRACRNVRLALEREVVNFNPISGLSRRAKEVAKDRVLSEPELTMFLETLGDPAVPCELGVAYALMLILATAARPGEVTGLPWSELNLDGDAPVWRLPRALEERPRARHPAFSMGAQHPRKSTEGRHGATGGRDLRFPCPVRRRRAARPSQFIAGAWRDPRG